MFKNKGIALITLVITIIILLIFLGILIIGLNGKKGLISKAQQAKKNQIEVEIKEQLILAINQLKLEKEGNATLDNITQEWLNEYLSTYKPTLKSSNIIDAKIITMQKDSIKKQYKINLDLSIEEIENANGKISLTYEIGEKTGKNIKILIKVTANDGIKEIHTPEPDIIYIYGGTEKAIDYVVELDVEYKFKIVSEIGEEKEEIIHIKPEIQITTPIIGTTQTSIRSVDDNSQIVGTTLYLRFNATLEGTKCTITPEVPYEITKNGKYKFIVTGIYNEKTIQKEIEIDVLKYQIIGGFVKYDAGDWTKEEIDELKSQKLYDINKSKEYGYNSKFKLEDDNEKGFTFGGFTYKGDNQNEKEIQEGIVITSRNQSVSTKDFNRK